MSSTFPASIQELAQASSQALESLYFGFFESDGQKATSDKVYGLFLSADPAGGYMIEALYGARKAAKLARARKASSLTLEKARKALGAAQAERLKKGYAQFDSAEALAEFSSDPAEGFALTSSCAKKLPAHINDGFSRPSLARCFGCSESEAAETLRECGGDLIMSEIAMVPAARGREAALVALEILSAQNLEPLDPDEGGGGLLGLWESPDSKWSMVGFFSFSPEGVERFPIEEVLDRVPGFQIADNGTDNYPGEAFGRLEQALRERKATDPAAIDFGEAALCLSRWCDNSEKWMDPLDHAELFQAAQQAQARRHALAEAREIESATPKARGKTKSASI